MNLDIAKKRLKIIQKYLFESQILRNKYLEGKEFEVLVENKLNKQNHFFGRIKTMTPVIFESNISKIGEIIKVKILSSNQNNLFGKHVEEKIKAA